MKKLVKYIVLALALAVLATCGGNGADYADSDVNGYSGGLTAAEATPSPSPVVTPQPIPQPTPEPEPEPIPFLWLVTAPHGQTMYVFGSIHAAPPDFFPLSPVIMDAFRRSDYLALEVLESEHPDQTDGLILTDGRAIFDYISEELHQRAVATLRQYRDYLPRDLGISYDTIETLDFMHPMVWWMVLMQTAVEFSNLSIFHGLDNFFAREASRTPGMGFLSIEDPGELDANLLDFSPHIFAWLIESSLDISVAAYGLNEGFELWRTGEYIPTDELTLDDLVRELEYYGIEPELLAEFLGFRDFITTSGRSLQMADRASEFMREGKKVFFVVGNTHLHGVNGVINQLAERGYQIERIRY